MSLDCSRRIKACQCSVCKKSLAGGEAINTRHFPSYGIRGVYCDDCLKKIYVERFRIPVKKKWTIRMQEWLRKKFQKKRKFCCDVTQNPQGQIVWRRAIAPNERAAICGKHLEMLRPR